MTNQTIFYNTSKYDFAKEVRKIFGIENLEELHKLYHNVPLVEHKNDQSTSAHLHFYANDKEFLRLYTTFIQEVVKPFWKQEKLVFQTVPTFRVSLPNNKAIGAPHKDQDYGHSDKEINHVVPLNIMHDSNSIWVESEPGKEDFAPIYVPYGEVFVFNGATLKHLNKVNVTEKTRVSFDFRIIKFEDYEPSEKKSSWLKKRFVIGDYFSLI